MKKNFKVLLSILLCVAFLCSFAISVFATVPEHDIELENQTETTTSLDTSTGEIPFTRIDVSDLIRKTPDESLFKPTNELFEDMLLYEDLLFPLVSSNSDYQYDSSHSSALQELERRSDAGTVLFNKYLTVTDLVETFYIEYLLQQEVFFSKLNQQELSALSDIQSVKQTTYSTKSSETRTISEIELSTYCGNTVIGIYGIPDFSNEQAEAYTAYYAEAYSVIDVLGIATYAYNCHSYAWYYPSTTNYFWINDIDGYLDDEHVVEVPISQMEEGNIVVYYDANNNFAHSAIVDNVNLVNYRHTECVSKWGPFGLYKHDICNVPPEYLANGELNIKVFKIYERADHSMTDWESNSTQHIRVCEYCPKQEIELHTFGAWVSVNSLRHKKVCSDCGYTVTGFHRDNYDTLGGYCRTCGYAGMILLRIIDDNIIPYIERKE